MDDFDSLDDDVCIENVKVPFPGKRHDLVCPECSAPMALRDSKHGPFYGCTKYPTCRSSHGAHPDGKPLGIPANEETKQWRSQAHKAFDQIWEEGDLTRSQAYLWMQEAMNLSSEEAHIGRFNIEQCDLLMTRIEEAYPLVLVRREPDDGLPF